MLNNEFLPATTKEAEKLGIKQFDFICVTGDCYVDHPSFGIAIIARELEHLGYSVAIIDAPDIKNKNDFAKFGKPRFAFMVTSGNIDSMVSKYTVAKKPRSRDIYLSKTAPIRPDRAVTAYCRILKELYPDTFISVGGLEGSLRRLSHYDYWDDKVYPSVLISSGADLISYGMGEHQTKEIARRLARGAKAENMLDIKGTCVITTTLPEDTLILPSFDKVRDNKKSFTKSFKIQYENNDYLTAVPLAEKYGDRYVLQNPPSPPLGRDELDKVYELPFTRKAHPKYKERIPSLDEVEFSIAHTRGCFGGCNFCAITFHQGKHITSRSKESVLKEAKRFTKNEDFKGYISDVGGPTANFRQNPCQKSKDSGYCKNKHCLAPTACCNVTADHSEYTELLRELREIDGIKKVFVRSGIRFDYMLLDKDETFFKDLVKHHISGQLKVAPEHCAPHVLELMGKPGFDKYRDFCKRFTELTKSIGKKQFLVPYLMSSHPGCTIKDAVLLAEYIRDIKYTPEQVQDFYPTPSTLSTCMYYTGINPLTGKEVYVPKTSTDKAMQRALLQYKKPENYDLVYKALCLAGREDLIGFSPKCLIKPRGKTKKKVRYKLK